MTESMNPYHSALSQVKKSPSIYLAGDSNSKELLYYGDFYIPRDKMQHHTLSLGSSGTGKSWLLKFSLATTLSYCTKGSKIKVIIIDTKGDLLPIAASSAQKNKVPLYYLNINDYRSIIPQESIAGYAWDIAKDCQGRDDLFFEALSTFFPLPERGEPFWAQTNQLLGTSKASASEKLNPHSWGLYDLYNFAFSSLSEMQQVLLETEIGQAVNERLIDSEATKTRDSVLIGFLVGMYQFSLAAAHQYYTPKERWFSIADFIRSGEGVLVIGQDLMARQASNPIIQAMFQCLVNIINMRPDRDNEPPDIFLYLDEFPYSGKLPKILDVLTFQRSKGVSAYLTAQGFEQIKAVYSADVANTLANNCDFKILFRTNSPETAEWSANLSGKVRSYEKSYSSSISASGGSVSINQNLVERPLYPSSHFINLPVANAKNGIYFHFISPYTYDCNNLIRISPEDVDYLKPPKLDIPFLIPKPAKYTKMPSLAEQAAHKAAKASSYFNTEEWINQYLNTDNPFINALRNEVLEFIRKNIRQSFNDLP
jgi:hypothetical protein